MGWRPSLARRAAALTLLGTLVAWPAASAALADLERALVRALQTRQDGRAALQALGDEARVQAEAIERLKAAQPGPRAGGELERRLRAFDGLARRLDEAEARLASAERDLRRARTAFDSEADAAERRLAATAADSGALLALAQARGRVAALTDPEERLRPPLDVRPEPGDGPAELRAKLELIGAEIRRFEAEGARLAADESVLRARLEARRALAGELAAARRQAGGQVPLLERAADEAARSAAALEARLLGRRGDIEQASRALRGLDQRRQDLRGQLERLDPGERERP